VARVTRHRPGADREASRPDICVALLRGINVGRAKRVAMADLCATVEGLGCRDVRTLLNSGNVVFERKRAAPDSLGPGIEKALLKALGVSSRVTVLTVAELRAIVAENPLLEAAKDPSRLLVAVPQSAADLARLMPLRRHGWAPEALAVGKRAAYLACPGGIVKSPLVAAVGRRLGDAVTTRNWTTLSKLAALAAGQP
jgi:uncharacterized protein (DUF1697 family)